MSALVATQIVNGRMGVSAQWLEERRIISMGALRQMEHRQRAIPLTRGGRGVLKIYEYNTLPMAIKEKIDAVVNVYNESRTNLIEQYISHDATIVAYFDEYKTSKGSSLPNSRENPVRTKYYHNALVLNAIIALCAAYEKRSEKVNWDLICEYVKTLDKIQYNIDLPENTRKLREKVRDYSKNGLESLIHKNYRSGNKNAAKVMTEEQQSMLISLIAEHRNFDNQEIANLYNAWASQHGWKTISRSLVQDIAKKNRFITMASKHGAEAFRNSMSYTVKRKAPSAAMYMWVFDGWDAELAYQKKDAKGRTTYHNRLTLEVVLDASTSYPIGYAVGVAESADLIKEALRNAERHVQELTGQMLRPHQLQCDNFAKKAMWDTYEGLAALAVTPARVGNAKSKIIEPWFGRFNDKVCKYAFNWTGHNLTAARRNQPNLDITLKNKSSLPTLTELLEEIHLVIGQYRAAALPAYQESLKALPEADKVALNMKQYLALFGQSTGQNYKLQSTGINVRIMGKKHQYDMLPASSSEKDIQEAIRFREMCWQSWNVLLDPLDNSNVLVENDDKTEQFLLTLKDEQPMALKDRKPGDYEKLAAIWKFNDAMEAHITKAICGYQQNAMEQVAQEKRDYELLSRALITDSRGQHKSVKAASRLAIAPVDAFEAAPDTESGSIYDDY